MIANLVLIILLPVAIMAMIGWRLVADHRRRLTRDQPPPTHRAGISDPYGSSFEPRF